MKDNNIPYGKTQSIAALGQLVRQHRKSKGLTLETVAGLANVSVRFFSEFERGKETAEIGKVFKALKTVGLDIVIQPRDASPARQDNTANTGQQTDDRHLADND